MSKTGPHIYNTHKMMHFPPVYYTHSSFPNNKSGMSFSPHSNERKKKEEGHFSNPTKQNIILVFFRCSLLKTFLSLLLLWYHIWKRNTLAHWQKIIFFFWSGMHVPMYLCCVLYWTGYISCSTSTVHTYPCTIAGKI